jgi:hypothetical protein
MTRQLLSPSFADFFQLLQKGSVLLKHFTEREDSFARALMTEVKDGCVILLVQGDRMTALTGDKVLALAAWKTPHSLALMIPQQERKSLINLLTQRNRPTDQHEHKQQQQEEGEEEVVEIKEEHMEEAGEHEQMETVDVQQQEGME